MLRSVGALLCLGLLTLPIGCSVALDAGAVDAPAASPAKVRDRWPGCAALGAFREPRNGTTVTGKGGVPPSFRPTAAVSCDSRLEARPDGTDAEVYLERRASAIGPLLSYLARPSQQARYPERLVCPAMAWTKPWLFLTDEAGRWISPELPTDRCGFPLDWFDASQPPPYGELPYRDTVVRQPKQPR